MTISFDSNTGKYRATVNGKVIESANKYYVKSRVEKLAGAVEVQTAAPVQEENAAIRFPINQRFVFVERLVKMVANRRTASALITGEGGLGKTHTVIRALDAAGLRDISGEELEMSSRDTYVVVKGFSTAKGLFRTLYENRNSIIVFDDCDSILRDDDAVNLLKGALDSYETRIVTWNSMRIDDELPRSFKFNGGVIFISNRPMNKIDQALRTRAMCVDLAMTLDQKMDRMEVIMMESDFMPNVSLSFKRDALELIRKLKDQAREVSMRTLITTIRIRDEDEADWEDLATYSLVV